MNLRLRKYLDTVVETMPRLVVDMTTVAIQSGNLDRSEVIELLGNLRAKARLGVLKGDACSTSLLVLPGVRKVCMSTLYLSTRGDPVESIVASVYIMTAPYLRVVTGEGTTYVELSGEPLNEFALYGIETLQQNPHSNDIVKQVCNDAGWYRPSPNTPEGQAMLKEASVSWQSMLDLVNASDVYKAEVEAFRKVIF